MFKKEILKEYLEKNNINNIEFASRIYVTEGMVRGILSGVKQPSIGTLKLIAREIGCTTDDLIII